MADDIEALAAEVKQAFLIAPTDLCSPLDDILPSSPPSIKNQIQIFRDGMEGCMKVASLPFTLTWDSVNQQRFNSFDTAERIRMLKVGGGELSVEDIAAARKRAHERMYRFIESDEGQAEIVENTLQSLRSLMRRDEVRSSLQELLLEAVVMIWGVFEVFVSDALRSLVNAAPEKALLLFSGDTKKYIAGKPMTIEAIASRDFNLTNCMGDLFFDSVRLDSLQTMRDVLAVLYPDESLRKAFGSNDLWRLWQRRNLIAHRRGVVDRAYIERTGDTVPIGQRIVFSGLYIDECAELVRDCALVLITEISRER
jgi:hypothetical protein